MLFKKLLCVLPLLFSQGVMAVDRISVGVGDANDDIEAFRIGLQKDFSRQWWHDRAWGISGYWEASVNHWTDDDSITALALSPVFILSPNRHSNIKPYIEAGVGVALISDTQIGRRQLSTTFHFEDRIGVGLRLGEQLRHDVNLRFIHYSNADIKKPNDGIDIFLLSYGYAFQ